MMKNNNTDFVAYEYKNIAVKRDSITIYTDCLQNFGWELVDEHREYEHRPASVQTPTIHIVAPVHTAAVQADEHDMMILKFKRDRRIGNKLEINRLERKCLEALASIGGMERKDNAVTMGVSLGAGIIGTGILAAAVYCFVTANVVGGVLLAALGAAGWGVGFFANRKMSQKRAAQTGPMLQAQIDIAYSACEQAYALLA